MLGVGGGVQRGERRRPHDAARRRRRSLVNRRGAAAGGLHAGRRLLRGGRLCLRCDARGTHAQAPPLGPGSARSAAAAALTCADPAAARLMRSLVALRARSTAAISPSAHDRDPVADELQLLELGRRDEYSPCRPRRPARSARRSRPSRRRQRPGWARRAAAAGACVAKARPKIGPLLVAAGQRADGLVHRLHADPHARGGGRRPPAAVWGARQGPGGQGPEDRDGDVVLDRGEQDERLLLAVFRDQPMPAAVPSPGLAWRVPLAVDGHARRRWRAGRRPPCG